MPSRKPPASAGKAAALPRGGGLAGGIKGAEQEDDETGEGRKKGGAAGEGGEALGDVDSMTLGEYNRWLITESNWTNAEEIREQHIEGEQFRKAREDRHRERGQLRQQDTVEQMKEAKTKVDAHRRMNLEAGSAVKRDVIAWNVATHQEKAQWQNFGKSVKAALIASDSTENRDALVKQKKKAGETVKKEINQLRAELEKQKTAFKTSKLEQAKKVRDETADGVIDAAKKFFFLQRKTAAKETTGLVQSWSTERDKAKKAFEEVQHQRSVRVKGMREAGRKAREALAAAKAEAASSLREQKQGFAEQRQQQLHDHSVNLKDAANSSISQRFVAPDESRRMLQHPHYSEVSAVVADVTSAVSREIASSPKRNRRPASALTMAGQQASPAASKR